MSSDPERTEEENEEFERKRKLRAKKRKQQMVQQIEDTKVPHYSTSFNQPFFYLFQY